MDTSTETKSEEIVGCPQSRQTVRFFLFKQANEFLRSQPGRLPRKERRVIARQLAKRMITKVAEEQAQWEVV